jgi:multiple sugar transport system permease protein
MTRRGSVAVAVGGHVAEKQALASQPRHARQMRRKPHAQSPGFGFSGWRVALPFVLPTMAGLLVFNLLPLLAAFALGFTDFNFTTDTQWIGLANYRAFLFEDPLFWKAMRNTAYYTVASVGLSVVLGLALALALYEGIKGLRFFRSVYFLPVVASTAAVSLIWGLLLEPNFGLVNYLLELVGIPGPGWAQSLEWAMPALILVTVWKTVGYNMVIFLAGLQDIPPEVREAARIDGANGWRETLHIVLPLLSPTTFFVVVISLITSFQVFDYIYIMTQGNPAYETLTLSYYIYQIGFQYFRLGQASSLSYILFAVVFLLTLLQFGLQRRWVHYQ